MSASIKDIEHDVNQNRQNLFIMVGYVVTFGGINLNNFPEIYSNQSKRMRTGWDNFLL